MLWDDKYPLSFLGLYCLIGVQIIIIFLEAKKKKKKKKKKMVRAPCCEKMGLKKGPWTPEEDQVLVAYIQRYGHGNWRALPKQAGLQRCGKSCRLRWTNYLRPDIKRGNFTREEEETIIKLHELLGNRWSAIAARLPGRTDNEIKNVWHTHLKKRLHQNTTTGASSPASLPDCSAYFLQQRRHPHPHHHHHHLDLPANHHHQPQMLLLENPVFPQQQQQQQQHPSTCQADLNYSHLQSIQLLDNGSMNFWFNLLVETDTSLDLPDI